MRAPGPWPTWPVARLVWTSCSSPPPTLTDCSILDGAVRLARRRHTAPPGVEQQRLALVTTSGRHAFVVSQASCSGAGSLGMRGSGTLGVRPVMVAVKDRVGVADAKRKRAGIPAKPEEAKVGRSEQDLGGRQLDRPGTQP